MIQALAHTHAVGVQTNVAFLTRLMQDTAFASADLDTGLIERQRDTLLPAPAAVAVVDLALATAAVLVRQGLTCMIPSRAIGSTDTSAAVRTSNSSPADPWNIRDGWRLAGRYQQTLQWLDNETLREIEVTREGQVWTLHTDACPSTFSWRAHPSANPNLAYGLRITLDGRESSGTVVLYGDKAYVFREGHTHILGLHDALAHAEDGQSDHAGGLTAPMPGKIISISVQAGDKVAKGQALLVMEAMKMEHTISAPLDGEIQEVFYGVGDQVGEGAELVAIVA